jgi:hypothetical protein
MTNTAATLDIITAAAANLEATHMTLPIAELQSRRAAAMRSAMAVYEATSLELDATSEIADRAAFDRAYDLVMRIDRIGY